MTKRQAYQQSVEKWRYKAGMKGARHKSCGFCVYGRVMMRRYGDKHGPCYYCPAWKATGIYPEGHPSYLRWLAATGAKEGRRRARNVLRALRRLGKKEGWDK